MARQLSFDLPAKTALGRDDFFVSPANAMAVAMIDLWPDWSGSKLTLTGPVGSGKTHLAHVWAAISGAQIIAASDLIEEAIPTLASGPVAIEDVPGISNDTKAQAALFHLHNLIIAEGHSILLTGRDTPDLWGLSLPDLQSRMQGAQNAILEDPDDALLSAVMAKLLADRQLTPPADVIPYLIRRMDRSFEAARALAQDLDRASLSEGRALTRALAARVLDNSL